MSTQYISYSSRNSGGGGGGGGTVTSVALSAPGGIFTVAGSPITGSGTLTLSLTNQSANTVFAGPVSGAAAAPTFRALVAADIPALAYVSDVTATAPVLSSGGATPDISMPKSTGSVDGYLAATDFAIFAAKQPAGNYITALTGDATASGPGSVALTLATVNSNVGSFGSASSVSAITVNAKGLITAASAISIQIAESQVTNLVSDLAGKQPVGNYLTALTGDATASGPGSAALTLATVNSNVGSFGSASSVSSITVNAKGLVTAAASTAIQIAESQVTNLVSDLAGKQPTGNYITALTGDVTATGPGSVAATVAAIAGTAVAGTTGSGNVVFSTAPALTGVPTAPTAGAGNNSTQIATTAYVKSQGYGTGTVTSVALADASTSPILLVSQSPITTSGTILLTLSVQAPNIVFAGPVSGGGAQPTFRSLVAADIPALPYLSDALTSGHLFIGSAGGVATDVALSGDATLVASGALTLATVNSNVGSFGSASSVSAITVNAKGLITAAASTSIQIAESQVTNLVADLAGKQATGNYITALTGDATASGPGSVAITLATVNADVGNFGDATNTPAFTVNAKGLITSASSQAIAFPVTSVFGRTGAVVAASADYSVGQVTGAAPLASPALTGTPTAPTAASTDNSTTIATTAFVRSTFVAPTFQSFASSSGTYTLPTSPRTPLYIKVRVLGGGGGGGGTGVGSTAGGTGGTSTFGSALISSDGGSGGNSGAGGSNGGAGGTATLGSGPLGIAITGGSGTGGSGSVNGQFPSGGNGASSILGGAGGGGVGGGGGGNASAASGSGGGGAGSTGPDASAGGGGAAGTTEALIMSPSSTYAYAVGAGGTAGAAGTLGNAGGTGGSGLITIEEFYQ